MESEYADLVLTAKDMQGVLSTARRKIRRHLKCRQRVADPEGCKAFLWWLTACWNELEGALAMEDRDLLRHTIGHILEGVARFPN